MVAMPSMRMHQDLKDSIILVAAGGNPARGRLDSDEGGTPGCPEIPDWLADNLEDGANVAIDAYLHTVSNAWTPLVF